MRRHQAKLTVAASARKPTDVDFTLISMVVALAILARAIGLL